MTRAGDAERVRGEPVAPRTATEAELLDIWADVLATDTPGVFDDFFDLGGTSLAGLEIVARAGALGLDFTVVDVFEHPTVAQLAELARARVAGEVPAGADGDGAHADEPAVSTIAFGDHGSSRRVFVLLPSLQDVHAVRELVTRNPALGVDVVVPAWTPRRPFVSIEHIAGAIATAIGKVGREGPYTIVGYCIAGLAALEVASRLRGSGAEVARLVLLDTVHPSLRPPLRSLAEALPVDHSRLDVRFVSAKLAEIDDGGSPEELLADAWPVIREHVGLLTKFFIESDTAGWDRVLLDRAAQLLMGYLNYTVAGALHQPGRYDGHVDLVYSELEGEGARARAARLGRPWRASGSTERVHLVPAIHTGLLGSDRVAELIDRAP